MAEILTLEENEIVTQKSDTDAINEQPKDEERILPEITDKTETVQVEDASEVKIVMEDIETTTQEPTVNNVDKQMLVTKQQSHITNSGLRVTSSQSSVVRPAPPAYTSKSRTETTKLGRKGKRKFDASQGASATKKSKGETAQQRLPIHGYPLEHPFNKDGYRYILAEEDPNAPKSNFDVESWAGKPIPGELYRVALHHKVYLASHDRAPQVKMSEDRLSVTGDKGYSMARATHGVNRGNWFFEVTVEDMPAGSASRIGWSQLYGNLQAPLGYDKFGYSIRSRKGTVFHQSRGKHYSDGYSKGDVIGIFISLPEENRLAASFLPPTYKANALIKFKGFLYYEEKDRVDQTEKELTPLEGSKIVFYQNGESKGVAFENVYTGTYYPAVSLYKNATVSVNFGPHFKFPPKDVEFRSLSEKPEDLFMEQSLSDLIFNVDFLNNPTDSLEKLPLYANMKKK
ncbi:set1/Ash2 histone methyltransferase complex subunit ASH2-like [Xenia sp. Carnegie-2017]|uniref:set1/Ash2 histone methyltransferase complex subunit ASH2-like n=1 Tax=Xenia sp. Carnegie-2017 TaxID=2897299 RepID=UPI001F04F4F1|nr:set1/Ash2 histone methyltransferase complex subunit ASH2-like [Xenia sp. Carnegie-2017]